MLEHKEIALSRGGRPVITACSVSAERGDAVALIGPNGSGKTTLLHLLSGLLAKDSGRLSFDGREIDPASPDWRYETAFVLDDGGTIPLLTVEEQLLLAGALSGLESGEAAGRADAVIRLLQLETHRRHRGDELSSGLRKRLGLGIGIIRDARIFLFDEPFSALDVEAAAVFIGIIEALKSKGRIVVFASHTLPFAGSLCSRVWRLAGGTRPQGARAQDVPGSPAGRQSFVESLQAETPRHPGVDLAWIG